jgi:hypothetical protein
MIDRADKILVPIVAGLLAFGAAATIGNDIRTIPGTPHPVAGSYFDTGEDGSAKGYMPAPLTLPEWAPETSESGAPVIRIAGRSVYYADGSYLWMGVDGTIYSWQDDKYDI